jgi:mannitol/fructose-specific phosphotransferase system IIA component (Ntr-type)
MHSALVDLLIEKGIITEKEYEKKIKQRIKIK